MKSFVIQLVLGLMPILVSAQFSLSGQILDGETQKSAVVGEYHFSWYQQSYCR